MSGDGVAVKEKEIEALQESGTPKRNDGECYTEVSKIDLSTVEGLVSPKAMTMDRD